MRVVFVASTQKTVSKINLDIFHLILLKHLLQEILYCKILMFKSWPRGHWKDQHSIDSYLIY